MNPKELRSQFAGLKTWKRNGERAPYKPLLALWAIARCLRGEDRMASYSDVYQALEKLLGRFGPHRKSFHPEYPFWRLRNDGIWEVKGDGPITAGTGGDSHVGSLQEQDAHGGFLPDVYDVLKTDKALAVEIAYSLVDTHFPPTLHDDVLEAVGILELAIDIGSKFEHVRRRHRDPKFSKTVLDAYGHRCAVCAFAVRLKGAHVALDAAHIRWHQARGPDKVQNGLALCVLHHRLFDTGAFTVEPDWRVVVSEAADGEGFDNSLERFHKKSLFLPASDDHRPGLKFLEWHQREVFRSKTL